MKKITHPALLEMENEKLRAALVSAAKATSAAEVGLIVDTALSQQAEPARAQDEREAFEAWFDREVWKEGCYGNPDILRRQLWPAWQAALAAPIAQTAPQPEQSGLLEWVVDRWHAEVASRPLINVHRRTLDSTWRQVIRRLGEDDVVLIGPRHDDMLDASGNPLPQYAALSAQGGEA